MEESKKKNIIGVDPGLHGAISIIDTNGRVIYCFDIPVVNSEIDSRALLKMMAPYKNSLCYLERPYLMKNQAGNITIGSNYGELKAVFKILMIDIVEVAVITWKSYYGLIQRKTKEEKEIEKKCTKKEKAIIDRERKNKRKILSYELAKKLYRKINFINPDGKINDGMVESLLIAEYGRETSFFGD